MRNNRKIKKSLLPVIKSKEMQARIDLTTQNIIVILFMEIFN